MIEHTANMSPVKCRTSVTHTHACTNFVCVTFSERVCVRVCVRVGGGTSYAFCVRYARHHVALRSAKWKFNKLII